MTIAVRVRKNRENTVGSQTKRKDTLWTRIRYILDEVLFDIPLELRNNDLNNADGRL